MVSIRNDPITRCEQVDIQPDVQIRERHLIDRTREAEVNVEV
jgi:hypothetical protein